MKFQSLVYLYDIVNPQSMAIDPKGNTAWIMGSYNVGSENKKRGRIWKVSLKKYWGKDAKGDKKPSMKEGPMIVTGHGQTLCYNQVTKTLWYLRETKSKIGRPFTGQAKIYSLIEGCVLVPTKGIDNHGCE